MKNNEHMEAQKFNDALEAIMAGDGVSIESGELSEVATLAEYLHQLDLAAHTTHLRREIRAQLGTQKYRRAVMRRQPMTIGIVLSFLLLGLFVLFPVKTLAQSVLRQIGGISLSTESPRSARVTDDELVIEPVPAGTAIPTAVPAPNYTDAEVQAQAGFAGWLPTFVPEGYSLTGHYVDRDYEGNPLIRRVYTGGADDTFRFLALDQWATVEDPEEPYGRWDIGDAPVRDIVVNNQEAVFVEQADIVAGGANILIWTADEYTFTMIATDLDQTTMVAIAESMQAP